MSNLRDKSDENQFKEYLKLKYPNKDTEELYNLIVSRRNKLEERKSEAEKIYVRLEKPEYKSDFSLLLFPDNNKLSSVPFYKRYAAYLVSEYGYKRACELLYLSRTSLWRLLTT